jgi:hypothetical protein
MGTDVTENQPVELWQSSLEGRRQHCRICDKPVLGLVGQDQAVTEGMVIRTAGLSPQVDTGWFHTRCVIDVGIGPVMFEMRMRGTGQRRSRSHGGYHAAFHDWLEEVQVCDQDGRVWDTTFDALRRAVQVDCGWLVPVEHDVDLLVINPKSSSPPLPVRGAEEVISLKDILSRLGVLDRLDYPFALDAGRFEPSRPPADSTLAGRLKYQMFLPDDVAQLVRS